MTDAYIYGLRDPRTNSIRYIGATTDPARRLSGHKSTPNNRAMAAWIADLEASRGEPQMVILQKIEGAEVALEVATAEQKWMDRAEKMGWPILNVRSAAFHQGQLKNTNARHVTLYPKHWKAVEQKAVEARHVTLYPKHWKAVEQKAVEVGSPGNTSAGLRALIAEYQRFKGNGKGASDDRA